MTDKSIILKEVRLNNHCPECYSNKDLVLIFRQQFVETTFYKALTENISHSLSCKKCNSEIFPVRWTDDIEQVVDYQIRAAHPKPKALKLKKIAWILIAITGIILIGIVLFSLGIINELIPKMN